MPQHMRKPQLPIRRHEPMRLAGRQVDADERIQVRDPYTNEVIATVPAARPEQVAEAFKIGHAFKPKLTRYERQKILLRTAEILNRRKDEIAGLITAESGLCLKDSL